MYSSMAFSLSMPAEGEAAVMGPERIIDCSCLAGIDIRQVKVEVDP
jgi:hypothetical protein